MNQISAYSLSGYQQGMGSFGKVRVEYEHCPLIGLVFIVFAAAMTGAVYASDRFDSIAAGWIIGVAILAMLGAVIDRWFSGFAAQEHRIRHREKIRQRA